MGPFHSSPFDGPVFSHYLPLASVASLTPHENSPGQHHTSPAGASGETLALSRHARLTIPLAARQPFLLGWGSFARGSTQPLGVARIECTVIHCLHSQSSGGGGWLTTSRTPWCRRHDEQKTAATSTGRQQDVRCRDIYMVKENTTQATESPHQTKPYVCSRSYLGILRLSLPTRYFRLSVLLCLVPRRGPWFVSVSLG
jgi:hypothetical protein